MTNPSGQHTPTRLQVLGGVALIASAVISVVWTFISASSDFTGWLNFYPFTLHPVLYIAFSLIIDTFIILCSLSGLFILHFYQPATNKILRIVSLALYGLYGFIVILHLILSLSISSSSSITMYLLMANFLIWLSEFIVLSAPVAIMLYSVCLFLNIPRLALSPRLSRWGRWTCWVLIGGYGFQLLRGMADYSGFYGITIRLFLSSPLVTIIATLIMQSALAGLGIFLLKLRVSSRQAAKMPQPIAMPQRMIQR